MKQRIYAELIEHRQEFFDKFVTKTFATAVIPRGDLDNVISASGRETTCQFIASFALGDAPLMFPGAKKKWDLSGGLPGVIPPESLPHPTREGHQGRSRDE